MVEHITVVSANGTRIRNTLYTKQNPRLLILLPGRGYLVSHTLLHLMTVLGRQLGYDVLAVQYAFQLEDGDFTLADMPSLVAESKSAIEQALAKNYDSMVLVGKSLGTMVAGALANDFDKIEKLILLTPVQKSHTMTRGIPTLAIIGTADGAYDPDDTIDTETVTWRVFDHLDHSLMVKGDVQASLKVLPKIMLACEAFLKK